MVSISFFLHLWISATHVKLVVHGPPELAKERLENEIRDYKGGNATEEATIVQVQRKLKCCGLDNKDEWLPHPEFKTFPPSCCPLDQNGMSSACAEPFARTCSSLIHSHLRLPLMVMATFSVITCALLLASVICSCCLIRSGGRKDIRSDILGMKTTSL